MNTIEEWPAGQTWAFQGTIVEDATAGTHVCTLTVVPGAGNEMVLQAGDVRVGNTATAQTCTVIVDDGSNLLYVILNDENQPSTTALQRYGFPMNGSDTNAAFATNFTGVASFPLIISGTMRLILSVTTTAISVTQTFAVVCRIKGTIPTATLADTVGVPTLATNTNRVF